MDDTPDPILNFFTPAEASQDNLLYTALSVERAAEAEEIRKAYRRAALRLHPDKHAGKTPGEKEEMSREFQKVGFAYAVLSDEKKRKSGKEEPSGAEEMERRDVVGVSLDPTRSVAHLENWHAEYDETGRTDESAFADAEEMGWDAYFESLFERIDRKVLDEDKARYQGSEEETEDLISAYTESRGSLPDILSMIPHSTFTDEPRLIGSINELIAGGKLKSTKTWVRTSTDEKSRAKREKAGKKEAREAEEAAKDLGVWDEFYGSGTKGTRKGDEKSSGRKDKKDKKDKKDEEADGGRISSRR
ncbi:hypothetical protein EHS25_006003 [Saitozyma podzolica]|uniref:J domain-containing protein n=1 Tax=Saitozyma podzolica TaxID=1890683 RepID=A0A427XTY7_9TREE|nr:hypothetical protein EHS25_006003 [Saitozyma podzolica]